jgi:hypothetical protein
MVWTPPVTVTRAYVYTFVTEFGEEGPPSDPTIATGNVGETWAISVTPPTTAMKTGRSLTKTRIYRTITSSAGVATYFFVADIDINATSYSDTKADSDLTANNTLASTGWTAPPSGLQGVVAMPNGILAGWVGNQVWFCEPYRPHAWPAAYQVSVDYPVVGLGVVGQTLVICTTGHPWTATGIRPATMSLSKINAYEPCISRKSIISTPEGVYYASPNGMVLCIPGAVQRVTAGIINQTNWNTLVDPTKISAVRFNGAYLAFEERASGSSTGLLLDVANTRVSYNVLTRTNNITAFQMDTWSTTPIFIQGTGVYAIDPPNTADIQPYKWRSKLFQYPYSENFKALKVYFTVPSGAPTLNSTVTSGLFVTLGSNMYGIVRMYADGNLVFARELRKSGDAFRLPSGFKATMFQIEIEARVIVHNIQLASTSRALRDV